MQESVKQDREKYLGGSDIPAILNISPFTTRYNLLLQKCGYYTSSFDGNEYTEYGNVLEPKIRDYINEDLDDKFYEDKIIIEPRDNEPIGIRCHTDGTNSDTILEIKTTSRVHDNIEEYKIYLVQLLFYMVVTNKKKGVLAVYHRPEDFNEEFDASRLRLYPIKIEDYTELVDTVLKAVEQFKKDLIKVRENPFINEQDLLPQVIPEVLDKVLMLENKLAEYEETKKEYEHFKAELKRLMEENGVKKWKTPNGISITLVQDGEPKTTKVFDEKRFSEVEPILYSLYQVEKTTNGRKGFIKITPPKKKGD